MLVVHACGECGLHIHYYCFKEGGALLSFSANKYHHHHQKVLILWFSLFMQAMQTMQTIPTNSANPYNPDATGAVRAHFEQRPFINECLQDWNPRKYKRVNSIPPSRNGEAAPTDVYNM